MATNELTLPSRSAVNRAERVEVRVGERRERDRQDVELASLDERQEERQRAVELGHLDLRPAFRSAAFAEADGRCDRDGRAPSSPSSSAVAMTGMPGPAPGRISWPRRRAGATRRTRRRAARPGCGSAPRSVASSRPPPPARQTSRRGCAASRVRGGTRGARSRRAGSRRRSGSPRLYATRGQTPVSPLPASCSNPATSRSGSVTPSARSEATTSRPWRRSATCIVSKSSSCAGAIQVASAARSSGVTLARRCARNWRALDAHQEAEDRIEDRGDDLRADGIARREDQDRRGG